MAPRGLALKGREQESSAAIAGGNPLDEAPAQGALAIVEDDAIDHGRRITTMLILSGFNRPAALRAFIFSTDIMVTGSARFGPTI